MEENLLGQLLKANDPATTRAVEQHLLTDPAAVHDLARLRAALAPLEADRAEVDPPADLWLRTLARVAESIVATRGPSTFAEAGHTEALIRRAAALATATASVPRARPAPPPADLAPTPVRRWNVVAVIGLSAAVLALVMPAAVQVRQRALQTACQDTMRDFFQAAVAYSDVNDGRFPQVGDGQTVASAADALKLAGYLPPDSRFSCPADPGAGTVPAVLPSYAYTLGYRDEHGQLRGLHRQPGIDLMPMLADAPRREAGAARPVNHRHGKNVLFTGGHVRFCSVPTVGLDGDDIFTNVRGQVGAGLYLQDASLGRPEEQP